eukprot:scaffold60552_cov28-Tisochrysis_lutea.AAC.4
MSMCRWAAGAVNVVDVCVGTPINFIRGALVQLQPLALARISTTGPTPWPRLHSRHDWRALLTSLF